MSGGRRAILGLVAAGRISAAEAERLLRVWSDAREELWIIAGCVLICAAQIHLQVSVDGLGHLIEGLARGAAAGWNAAGTLISKGMGGAI